MKKEVTENITKIITILNDTKKAIAISISEDIMKGIFVVSEENQHLLKTIETMTDNLKKIINGSVYQRVVKIETDSVKTDDTFIADEADVCKRRQPGINEVPDLNIKEVEIEDKTKTAEIEKAEGINANSPTSKDTDWLNDNPFSEDKFNEDDFSEVFEQTESYLNDETKTIKDIETESNNNSSDFESDSTESDNIVKEISDTKPMAQAEIIGEINPDVSEEKLPFYGLVTNERQKKSGDFIYNKYVLSASKVGFSSASNITLFVSPLQVIPNNPNVPIIVHVYSHGNFKTASSYDTKDSGHNIVTIEIDNFYLLVRGGFDSEGKFVSFVMTTGLSANQGDIINILDKEEGYTGPILPGSGHIKFKEDDNVYEIFPLSMTENEYLCILISKEFLDYYVVARNYGSPKVRIFENGTQKEIVAGWSGDIFEADVI